ncbi:MAG: hypothetical protein HC941_22510, partial [Microcoleus sp. SU_5_3]|nr:hypothetical protein [Microcoleus sp. SU_5_3]
MLTLPVEPTVNVPVVNGLDAIISGCFGGIISVSVSAIGIEVFASSVFLSSPLLVAVLGFSSDWLGSGTATVSPVFGSLLATVSSSVTVSDLLLVSEPVVTAFSGVAGGSIAPPVTVVSDSDSSAVSEPVVTGFQEFCRVDRTFSYSCFDSDS